MQYSINKQEREEVIALLSSELERRIEKHGDLSFNSPHEIRGVLEEEFYEHLDELRANDLSKQLQELLDIAVAAIWGVASIIKNSKEI